MPGMGFIESIKYYHMYSNVARYNVIGINAICNSCLTFKLTHIYSWIYDEYEYIYTLYVELYIWVTEMLKHLYRCEK